ncbi:MAG: ATP12 family protein [Pseudomonadota bacterium]
MRDILENAEGAEERGETGPGKANREYDKKQFPKRFYKTVSVKEQEEGGFALLLDEKPLQSPGKNRLLAPTLNSAELLAEEWRKIETEINPMSMPMTRLANTAIDGVSQETQAVMEDITRYASSDLLLYRADTPEGLIENQMKHWDPLLDWAAEAFDAQFETGTGIIHVPQSKDTLTKFGMRLQRFQSAYALTCIHTLTSLSGSAIIALALAEQHIDAETGWKAAHVDEDWNISLWGEDFEAAERRRLRWLDFEAANRLLVAVH